jgi:hypothetical protein
MKCPSFVLLHLRAYYLKTTMLLGAFLAGVMLNSMPSPPSRYFYLEIFQRNVGPLQEKVCFIVHLARLDDEGGNLEQTGFWHRSLRLSFSPLSDIRSSLFQCFSWGTSKIARGLSLGSHSSPFSLWNGCGKGSSILSSCPSRKSSSAH